MKYIPWVLIVVMMFATGFTVRHYRGAARSTEIELQNLEAAMDSTRRVLRGQIEASTRLAAQANIRAEDATEAMQQALNERDATLVSMSRMEVEIDSLVVVAQTPRVDTVLVENGDTVRVATFVQQGPPIEGEQTVRVSQRITLDSRLRVSPFSIGYGIACSGTAPVFTWDTPEWVRTNFLQGTVDPGVCYTPSSSLFEISAGKSIWLLVGVGIGFGLASL